MSPSFAGVPFESVDSMKPDHGKWLIHGPQGCIAPWTRIYDPLSGEHREVWTIEGESIVSTLDGDYRTDGAPFIKGEDHLWTVRSEDGHEITVTAAHRFLTPQGWRRLDHVRVGQPLVAAPHAPQETSSACRCASLGDALRSTGTAEDSRRGYLTCPRCGGPRPLPAATVVRASAPSPIGDAVRNRGGSRLGDRGSSRGGIRAYPRSILRPRSGCVLNDEVLAAGRVDESPALLPGVTSLAAPLSPQTSSPAPVGRAVGHRRSLSEPAGSQRSSALVLERPYPYDTRIESITYAGYGVYYDLSVPGPEHYFAEGLIHHNSGKTRLASTIAELGRTLFIDLIGEHGVRSFEGAPYVSNIDVIRPTTTDQFDEIFWQLATGSHDYQAVVLDSLTALQKMSMRYVRGFSETAVKEIKRNNKPADRQDWGQTLDIMADTATFWYGLAAADRDHPMHVVMTAQTKAIDDEESKSVKRMPDVQKGALSIVLSTPDYILFTDVEKNYEEVSEDGEPAIRHIVRFGEDPDYAMKARVPERLQGKIPPILGRKRPTNLAQLSRILGIGGAPAAKKASTTTTTPTPPSAAGK